MTLPPFFTADPKKAIQAVLAPVFDRLWVEYVRNAMKPIGIWTGQAVGSLAAILPHLKSPQVQADVSVLWTELLARTAHSSKRKNPGTGMAQTLVNAGPLSLSVDFGVPYFEENDLYKVPGFRSTPWHSVSAGFEAMEKALKSELIRALVMDGLKSYFGTGAIHVGKR